MMYLHCFGCTQSWRLHQRNLEVGFVWLPSQPDQHTHQSQTVKPIQAPTTPLFEISHFQIFLVKKASLPRFSQFQWWQQPKAPFGRWCSAPLVCWQQSYFIFINGVPNTSYWPISCGAVCVRVYRYWVCSVAGNTNSNLVRLEQIKKIIKGTKDNNYRVTAFMTQITRLIALGYKHCFLLPKKEPHIVYFL